MRSPSRMNGVRAMPFVVVIIFSFRLFRVRTALPKSERVALRVLADGKIAHLRNGCFRHADLATEPLDFLGELGYRIHAHVIDHWLLWLFAFLDPAVGRIVAATSINVPKRLRSGSSLDFPAKQVAVKFFDAFRVIGRDSKPNDAVSLFLLGW